MSVPVEGDARIKAAVIECLEFLGHSDRPDLALTQFLTRLEYDSGWDDQSVCQVQVLVLEELTRGHETERF